MGRSMSDPLIARERLGARPDDTAEPSPPDAAPPPPPKRAKPARRKRGNWFTRLLGALFALATLGAVAAAGGGYMLYQRYSADLPDHIKDVPESILEEIIACPNNGNEKTQCTKAYRIIKPELDFLRNNNCIFS